MISIANLRKDYALASLDEHSLAADPLTQFNGWLAEALKAEIPEPTAMNLATVNADGRPSARIVLLKGVDEAGFIFYTNYDSHKGQNLAAKPFAALTFHWVELERQVRIEGRVEKVGDALSDEYYYSRPALSRIGAIASPQSAKIESREWLEARFLEAKAAHGETPKRPAHWGGYRVVPARVEFWQGRRSRLHDRLVYEQSAAGWQTHRLAP